MYVSLVKSTWAQFMYNLSIQCKLYRLYSISRAVYIIYCIVYSLQCALYSVRCTEDIRGHIVYKGVSNINLLIITIVTYRYYVKLQCTSYIVYIYICTQYIIYYAHYIHYTLCTLYTVHCTLYSVQYTQ